LRGELGAGAMRAKVESSESGRCPAVNLFGVGESAGLVLCGKLRRRRLFCIELRVPIERAAGDHGVSLVVRVQSQQPRCYCGRRSLYFEVDVRRGVPVAGGPRALLT